MDIHMPVMDGLEATKEIIAMDIKSPIVAMTANVMSEDRELYITSGMYDYLGKPFTSQELWRCLLKFLSPVAHKNENDQQKDEEAADILEQKLIKSFIMGNINKINEISEAIYENDLKLAHRLAHTLKSNAAQLGKTALQQAAGEVERCLKNEDNDVTTEQMASLEYELEKVLSDLYPLVQENEEIIPVEPMDEEETKELLDKVEFLLRDCDFECLSFIKELRRISGSGEVIKQMENMNFNIAADLLANLRYMRSVS